MLGKKTKSAKRFANTRWVSAGNRLLAGSKANYQRKYDVKSSFNGKSQVLRRPCENAALCNQGLGQCVTCSKLGIQNVKCTQKLNQREKMRHKCRKKKKNRTRSLNALRCVSEGELLCLQQFSWLRTNRLLPPQELHVGVMAFFCHPLFPPNFFQWGPDQIMWRKTPGPTARSSPEKTFPKYRACTVPGGGGAGLGVGGGV